ncbi:RND family transporter [Thermotoga sp. KOL6]|uniref:efflux RND transporter permease subunit n=1 Tax=Thermotoga sp. KOL6 TaxID=126741 RepID=UPI000C78D2E5|nr:MMPL family transporter [Thermotoga sp. KOL6]PLV59996.1 RND transporter [Thermotoga sp. KOL6]
MFKKYVIFVSKNRKKLLILVLFLNIISLIGLFRLNFSVDFSIFMPQNSHQKMLYEKMMKTFGSGEQIVVMVKMDIDPLSKNGISEIFKIKELLSSVEEVKVVIPPLPEKFPVGFKLVETKNLSDDQYREFLDYVQNMGDLSNIKKTKEGFYALFVVLPKETVSTEKIEKVLGGYVFYLSGTQYLEERIFRYLLFMIFSIPPFAVLLLLGVFRLQMGSFKFALFALIPAGLAALWTLGTIMGWLGQDLSVITVLVPIFTIVMGSADGLHFVSHFLEKKREGETTLDALEKTLESVGRAMILTTLTTMAGFLSFLTLNSQSMKQMGVLAATGVGLAGISTWIVLPLILMGIEEVKISEKQNFVFSIFQKLSKHAWLVTIGVLLLFIPGLFLLRADLNILKLYKSYTEVRRNVEKIEEVFGRALPVYVIFESQNIFEPSFAQRVLTLREELRDHGYAMFSVYDIIEKLNERLFKEKGYPRLLARALIIKRFLPEEYLENFISDNKGRALIFLNDLDKDTLEEVSNIVKKHGLEVTGIPFIVKEMNDTIVPQQVESLILAIGMVFLLLVLFQKSLIQSAKAIVPVSISLVSLFGFMGLTGIPLNLITANMGGIVIGVGIDYAIHVVELYRYYKNIEKTVRMASIPVLTNAYGLAVGLSALLLSPFTFHAYLVAIMWITMTISSFTSLVVLPKLLQRRYRE